MKEELVSWIKTIVLAVIIALFINNFVIVNATVPTGSMENTIMPKDRIIALRWSYNFTQPSRGDIVVFKFPDDEEVLYVKRIVALPGETVKVEDGKVYINDSDIPLDEPFIKEAPIENSGPFQVPEDHYFMMGDNRNNSSDSRHWVNKYVDKKKILGKVFLKYFPTPEILSNK